MTSLDPDQEHDTQNTQNTNSDCDWDCWDADNWGDMEQHMEQPAATPSVPLNPANSKSSSGHSPKANEQWTSLEEEPEEETIQGVQEKNDSSEVGWDDSEFQPLEDVQPFEQPSVPSGNNKFEEARRKREERKLARQRQMEAKRAVKLRANPTAKKI